MNAYIDNDYKEDKETKTRLYYYDLAGKEVEYPKLNGADYLLQHIKNIGMGSSNGFGLSPITYLEIQSYADLNGYEFTPNEINTLREMSVKYCQFIQDKNPNAQKPT